MAFTPRKKFGNTPLGAGGAPSGTAGGDLAGTYPNPTVKSDVGLTGNPTAPTQASSDDSTRIASTAFVQALFTALRAGVSSAFDTLAEIATELGLKAPLASPALTGTPTTPTASAGTNNTQIASTAYVDTAVSAAVGGGLVLLESHTASGSAALNFTTCLTSTYDTYIVEFQDITPATNGAIPGFHFSTDGGSTYVNTGNLYDMTESHAQIGTGTFSAVAIASGNAGYLFHDGAGSGLSSTGLPGLTGSMKLYDPLNATNYKFTYFEGRGVYSGNGASYMVDSTCLFRSATAVNAFRFLMSTGNIASGIVRVYGVAK